MEGHNFLSLQKGRVTKIKSAKKGRAVESTNITTGPNCNKGPKYNKGSKCNNNLSQMQQRGLISGGLNPGTYIRGLISEVINIGGLISGAL